MSFPPASRCASRQRLPLIKLLSPRSAAARGPMAACEALLFSRMGHAARPWGLNTMTGHSGHPSGGACRIEACSLPSGPANSRLSRDSPHPSHLIPPNASPSLNAGRRGRGKWPPLRSARPAKPPRHVERLFFPSSEAVSAANRNPYSSFTGQQAPWQAMEIISASLQAAARPVSTELTIHRQGHCIRIRPLTARHRRD